MEEVMNGVLIREVETKNIMTKSSLPVGGYSVNPYVGCTHACKYCYASFMKRFTGHKQAHKLGIPVFMKEDLVPIIGDENMIQEMPEEFNKVLEVQKSWKK